LNVRPAITSLVLNTTDLTKNDTNGNVTAYAFFNDSNADSVKLIYNWLVDSSPLSILHMPFERVNGSDTTNAYDYSGKNNQGTVFGTIWNVTGGYNGKGAYGFDGTTDYINISDGGLTNLADFSISFWMKPQTTTPSTGQVLIGKNSESVAEYWLTLHTDGTLRGAISTAGATGTTQNVSSSGSVSTGWTHVVWTNNASDASNGQKLYLNNVQDGTGVGVDAIDGNRELTIGTQPIDYGRVFTGTLDEVQIWNKSLSLAQVSALFHNQTHTFASTMLNGGENWTVDVTPNDGYEDGARVRSNSVSIVQADSCTYLGGNWQVACADNCLISSPVDLGGNALSITGTGTFQTSADITGYSDIFIAGTDSTNQCNVMCTGGGCFK
jgi:hypothetical protein